MRGGVAFADGRPILKPREKLLPFLGRQDGDFLLYVAFQDFGAGDFDDALVAGVLLVGYEGTDGAVGEVKCGVETPQEGLGDENGDDQKYPGEPAPSDFEPFPAGQAKNLG